MHVRGYVLFLHYGIVCDVIKYVTLQNNIPAYNYLNRIIAIIIEFNLINRPL